jgi:hypothetical protein
MPRLRREPFENLFPEVAAARSRANRREALTSIVLYAMLAALAAVAVLLFQGLTSLVGWLCSVFVPDAPGLAPPIDTVVKLLLG